mmetsp:Transcript_22959/g.54871  ORF Transcript_22959/g.54871 Transcript_22959/m.54871 type:complete len:289 (+) Transcript_22959:92-958(+)
MSDGRSLNDEIHRALNDEDYRALNDEIYRALNVGGASSGDRLGFLLLVGPQPEQFHILDFPSHAGPARGARLGECVVHHHPRPSDSQTHAHREDGEAAEDVDGEHEARREEHHQPRGPDRDRVGARDVRVCQPQPDRRAQPEEDASDSEGVGELENLGKREEDHREHHQEVGDNRHPRRALHGVLPPEDGRDHPLVRHPLEEERVGAELGHEMGEARHGGRDDQHVEQRLAPDLLTRNGKVAGAPVVVVSVDHRAVHQRHQEGHRPDDDGDDHGLGHRDARVLHLPGD